MAISATADQKLIGIGFWRSCLIRKVKRNEETKPRSNGNQSDGVLFQTGERHPTCRLWQKLGKVVRFENMDHSDPFQNHLTKMILFAISR